jgi:hypothetical protein
MRTWLPWLTELVGEFTGTRFMEGLVFCHGTGLKEQHHQLGAEEDKKNVFH